MEDRAEQQSESRKEKMNDPEDNIQDLWDTIKRLNSQICHKRGNFDTD